MEEIYNSVLEKNKRISNNRCRWITTILYRPIETNITIGLYTSTNGDTLYQSHVDRFKRQYNARANLGEMVHFVLFCTPFN